jgi:hypothetical protein
MAPHNTGPSCGGGGETYGDMPDTEARDLGHDQPPLAAGMGGVAPSAGPPLLRKVDVEVMQVAVTVTEAGKLVGQLILSQIAVMADKTEFVVGLFVRPVKLFGITLLEEMPVWSAMRHVATNAISGCDRLVNRFPFSDLFVMALETELGTRFFQQLGAVALVRIMAGEAVAISNGWMGKGELETVFMAGETELSPFFLEKLGIGGAVNIVAVETVARRYRAMDNFFGSHVVMAFPAELLFLAKQVECLLCLRMGDIGQRHMTGGTLPGSYRLVLHLTVNNPGVASLTSDGSCESRSCHPPAYHSHRNHNCYTHP